MQMSQQLFLHPLQQCLAHPEPTYPGFLQLLNQMRLRIFRTWWHAHPRDMYL
jgi:hypothetical protein